MVPDNQGVLERNYYYSHMDTDLSWLLGQTEHWPRNQDAGCLPASAVPVL